MIPRNCPFGFSAEYLKPSPAYDEFEEFLRLEFAGRPLGWDPRFGKVVRYDDENQSWDRGFLVTGSVPGVTTIREAEERVRALFRDLGSGLRRSHANPGHTLPEPVIRVWEWVDVVAA